MKYRRAVLMGDPSEFQILGGANPHTRTRWGFRKTVDKARAKEQWHRLAGTLTELGVRIFVVPPVPGSPGLVFPANAGFMRGLYEPVPISSKTFYVSQPIRTRSAEKDVYTFFIRALGIRAQEFAQRFEGEADFFPAGDVHLFTSGEIKKQRFVPRLGWPPYRRVYGFRSAPSALEELRSRCPEKPILPLTLLRETHYHGDTCLCAFGKDRAFLMAYLPALSEESQARLREQFRERLLPLSEEDGELFSANAFQVDASEPALVLPHTATETLMGQIRERGVRPVPVDVSEFMGKGGGSVKCMIGDLGLLSESGEDVSPTANQFRRERQYGIMAS
jgi:N-dimethylarginine dimethylaminohydrolase